MRFVAFERVKKPKLSPLSVGGACANAIGIFVYSIYTSDLEKNLVHRPGNKRGKSPSGYALRENLTRTRHGRVLSA